MTVRVIPVQPLNHGSDCRICAAVDRHYAEHKRRRATRRAGESPDLAGAAFGAPTASRDAERRQPAGSPDATPSRRAAPSAAG